MRTKNGIFAGGAIIFAAVFMLSGCAVNFYKQSPRSKEKIKDLKSQISDLEREKRKERRQLEQAMLELERKLKGKVGSDKISMAVGDRGLVIILSDNVLFSSGKAEIKSDAYPVLDNVIAVIKTEVPRKKIGISGHTDNVPITYSKWKSNWELSSARATNVLHYMEGKGVSPKRLSATGYGEYRPIASNNTEEGRAQNRRVEIVILPEFAEKRPGETGEDLREFIK